MLLPQDIMMKVSQHYADHMDRLQTAAEADDEAAIAHLESRHDNFKANVNKLLDIKMMFCGTIADIKAPSNNLFSVTVNSAFPPVFPDFIGKHTKLLVAQWDDVYTCLYSLDAWEEEYDPLS